MTPTRAGIGREPPPRSALSITVRIVLVAVGFRLASAAVAFLANVTLPDRIDQRFSVFASPNAFWDTFARYDSGWYSGIAARGYAYVEGGRSNLAFFPLYPLLMRWGGWALGGEQQHFYLAGVVVSWLAFAAAMVLVYRLARLDLAHAAALRCTAYAAVFPSAYFFGVAYSESLFYCGLVGAVLALRTRRYGWAVVAGAAMTATRVNGVMFVPALAWIAWQSAEPSRSGRVRALAAAAGAGLGFAAYCAYNYLLSGDPLAWYHSIQRWGYYPGGNPASGLVAIARALLTRPYQFLSTEAMAPYDAINATMAIAVLVLVPFVWRRLGFGYALVIALGLVLPLSTGQFEGLGRYCSVLFPVSIWLGGMQGEARHLGLMAALAMFYALALALFVNVHPLF